MKLKLFDSLKKQICELELVDKPINIYLCGPTVYSHVHIGNMRPVIVFDVLIRLLSHLGINTNYIHNITDIDDKIIAKAEQEEKTEKEISAYYTRSYLGVLNNYNIKPINHLPKVTDYIFQIQQFIVKLLNQHQAYQQDNEILFSLKQKKYGELSGQKLHELKSRVNNSDFVLWKKTNKGIKWDSPWGPGRPGWHTECVTFINHFFNEQTIDIHGGGNDLLFPHHENERIQYLAHNNRELSQVWLHIAHINWNKIKMSKSFGNVISAHEFAKKYGANVLRYLILSVPYRQVINLTEKLIIQGQIYLNKIESLLKRLTFYSYINKTNITKSRIEDNIQQKVIENLLEDLNTRTAFYYLDQIINDLNSYISQKKDSQTFKQTVENLWFILDILGFKIDFPEYDKDTKALIKEWTSLRDQKKYKAADQIRDELKKKMILP